MNLKFITKRLERNLNQKELSKELNLTSQSISDYERGKTIPNDLNKKKIADYFNTTVDDLFFRE